MLTDDVKLLSVDDHMIEPPEAWVSRLPKRYQYDCPQVVPGDSGCGTWMYEGFSYPINSLGAVAGLTSEQITTDAANFSDMSQACVDQVVRLADMDAYGVSIQICFPAFACFGGARFLQVNARTGIRRA